MECSTRGVVFPTAKYLGRKEIAGLMLLLLTAFFYVPIFAMEIHSPLAVEGINYVGDTLLFAGTVLLAGFGADLVTV